MSLGSSHFWLRLYQLNEALEASGGNSAIQVEVILDDLLTMPLELQNQSLDRLEKVSRVADSVAASLKARRDRNA